MLGVIFDVHSFLNHVQQCLCCWPVHSAHLASGHELHTSLCYTNSNQMFMSMTCENMNHSLLVHCESSVIISTILPYLKSFMFIAQFRNWAFLLNLLKGFLFSWLAWCSNFTAKFDWWQPLVNCSELTTLSIYRILSLLPRLQRLSELWTLGENGTVVDCCEIFDISGINLESCE